MFRFVIRRLLWAIPTLLFVTFLIYVAIRIGTDPAAAFRKENPRATPKQVQAYKDLNGLYEGFWGYVRGYFILSQHVANLCMIPRQKGRILNIASIAGLAGNPAEMETIAYNTSKGAVVNFTRALAGEWGEHGITVNAICPGFFPTKMANGLIEKLGSDKMAQGAPMRRLGDDEDLKGLTLLYASDAGKHITGQWLAVDGGVSAIIGG